MLKRDYHGPNCSIARALEVVGERWTLLIVRDAFLGLRRFDEFQESLGIARNVLTDRLNRLVEEGILERVPTANGQSATSTASPPRAASSTSPSSGYDSGATNTSATSLP
jgi:DNA-binding HxlR family transcriptional regulator